MTAKRFTVDSDGKYWDTVSKKYVTIDHLFYLVEKMEKENEQLKQHIKRSIEMLEIEKEAAISQNERNRLDFAIFVLKELEE